MNRIVFRSPFCRLRRHTIVASNSSITAAAATTTTSATNEKTATTHHRFVTTAPSVSGFNHRCVLFDHHYHLSKKTTGLSRCSFSSTSNTTTGGTTTTNDNNSSTSSSSNSSDGLSTEIRSVYVHPLSQVVLEYLQDCRYEWIIEKGLDRSLTLHRDGSFEVKFAVQRPLLLSPPTPSLDGPSDSDIVHQQKNVDENNNNNNIEDKNSNGNNDDKNRNTEAAELTSIGDDNEVIMKGTTTTTIESSSSTISTSTSHVATTTTTTTDDNIRIWTSYDEQEKKHWLTVRKGLFRQRFLLQDNLSMAWNGNRGTSEHIHVAVDEMIRAVDRLESSAISTSTSSQTT
ncbi:hypothetical protein FRACYDRAFT_260876 [Fragilariopsis cylindrus CCMP1102]|uniref:Uncharacterized protein n=1 Tax=Fragilariopsis cylindrus CCMP1102 TaxID=635003 RepID=A0A1E7FH06_9STRA|nr:hypothetical protein FRACYDRAFT_260876 [Fragilariopsis cylindrus CCMP1102]|eukprot:OEU17459.1 hypothetical protein FRACYDRAFT_260876 [Fragilariopsis cylindrus CCMP1102]